MTKFTLYVKPVYGARLAPSSIVGIYDIGINSDKPFEKLIDEANCLIHKAIGLGKLKDIELHLYHEGMRLSLPATADSTLTPAGYIERVSSTLPVYPDGEIAIFEYIRHTESVLESISPYLLEPSNQDGKDRSFKQLHNWLLKTKTYLKNHQKSGGE